MNVSLDRIWALLAIGLLLLAGSVGADTNVLPFPACLGVDLGIPIRDVAPEALQPACRLLEQGQRRQAATLFAQSLKDPDYWQIAYVGWAHSLSHEEQAAQVQSLLNGGKQDDQTQFDLAVLLLYEAQFRDGPALRLHFNIFDDGYNRLADLWRRTHLVLAGLILLDHCAPTHDGWKWVPTDPLIDNLLKLIGGSGVLHTYRYAIAHQWDVQPPTDYPVAAPGQRRLLVALLNKVKLLHRDSFTMQQTQPDGTRQSVTLPGNPVNLAAQKFLQGWIDNLKGQH